MTLKATFDKIPNLIKVVVGIGLVIFLGLFLWYKGTQVWNGFGNFFFHRQINSERLKVQKDLEDAAKQKVLLEQTLKEYKAAKDELVTVKAEKDRLEGIFNDLSKTAAQKVAEFKKAIADDPVHTPTDNITTDDLCQRAKAIGASPATITAMCGH